MTVKGDILIYNEKMCKQLRISDIVRIESCMQNYCMVQLANKKILVAYCLKRFSELLDNRLFVRVSRSCILNANLIDRIDEDGKVFSRNQHIATYSRRYLQALRK